MGHARDVGDEGRVTDPDVFGGTAAPLLQGLADLDLGIAVVDLEARRLVYVNHVAHRFSGYTDEELSTLDVVGFLTPDELDRGERVTSLLRSGARESHVMETCVQRKDGSRLPVEVASRRVMIQGRPHVLSFFRDISRRKRVEEYAAHVQKMEAVGRLARGVAHDFNNLLGAIKNQCQLLAEEQLDPAVMQSIAEIEGVAEMGARIAEQLLHIARRRPFEPATLDIAKVLDESHGVLTQLVGENVHLEIIGDGPAPAVVDRAQFEQLVINLVINAKDAMPSGGELKVETRRREIDVVEAERLRLAEGEYVVVEVSDTGTGIHPSDRSRIFEPFYSTKNEEQSTGLGLATAYSTVMACGGAIDFKSEVDLGTTFVVYLPAVRDEARA